MSANSFGDLYQAERENLSAYHQQRSSSQELSEPLLDPETNLSANTSSSSEQSKAGFTELLKLKVKVESTNACASAAAMMLGSPSEDASSNAGGIEDLEPMISPGRGVPFVSYVPDDLVALCSSGGGIRSAIFNLGVLQGLDNLGLLPLIDYHSTVSGGGYLGGWWTSWRANKSEDSNSSSESDKSEQLYPKPDKNLVEHSAIRRLRERSRFLSPTGFALSAEIWSGMLLWVLGLIGTMLMALSVVSAAITIWSSLRVLFFGWFFPAYKPHLLALLLLALFLSLVSEWVTGLLKLNLRRFGVGLFLAAGVGLVLDGLWILANSVRDQTLYAFLSSIAIGGAGSWVIRWLAGWVATRGDTHAPNSVVIRLSHFLPQLVAGLVIASMAFVLMLTELHFEPALILESFMVIPDRLSLPAAALLATLSLAAVGHLIICIPSTLHRFYSRRIEESFLRVKNHIDSHPTPTQNWPRHIDRPIQIVNCCASDTCYSTTDQIDRRGTNVGLSAIGAYPSALGAMPDITSPSLSEAITASAAAVDPSMGFYSAKLGRLVAFVLFALNLRLGTWWKPNQMTSVQSNQFCAYLRSRFTLRPWKEMLSQITLPKPTDKSDHEAYSKSNLDLRLTDGGHFDNLAAYEMIRRRCRYVVICDGGADPGNHFAELSSLQRLVRRDFGVEIEIDLDPLRTDEYGISQRHLAAGRILYPDVGDGKSFSDDGVLIYVKPSLTGDEPEDLTQYQASNHDFPHETTADQFFDDNQWEAYRKLGEHSITQDLKFVGKYPNKKRENDPKRAARLFNAAIRELGSEDHKIRTARSNTAGRFVDRFDDKPSDWIEELLSELKSVDGAIRDDARKSLLATMGLLEELEEAYYRCDLKRHGDHLENWGVENRVDRIAASSEVRRWWPVIASLYSIPFRNYLGSKYGLNVLLPLVNRELVTLSISTLSESIEDPQLSKSVQRIQRTRGNSIIGDNEWVLHGTCQIDDFTIDLGAIAFTLSEGGDRVEIYTEDMQIAPGYWSIGHNVILMDALLDFFGFDASGSSSMSKPNMPSVSAFTPQDVTRIVIKFGCKNSDKNPEIVQRPDHRHSWIQRGFVQTRSGFLVRDQKDHKRAGMYCNG